jgi:hypothetical protein
MDVVCWGKPVRDKADIQLAVTEDVSTYKDVTVYKLRSLDGKPIQSGDSGGGVWYEGV